MASTPLRADSARCNVVPLPAAREGTTRTSAPATISHFPRLRTAEGRFRLALAEAELARARFRVTNAEARMASLLGGDPADEAGRSARDAAHREMMRAALALAQNPAPKKRDIVLKCRAIGPVWLKAEGEFYDKLRAGIDADRARLAIIEKR